MLKENRGESFAQESVGFQFVGAAGISHHSVATVATFADVVENFPDNGVMASNVDGLEVATSAQDVSNRVRDFAKRALIASRGKGDAKVGFPNTMGMFGGPGTAQADHQGSAFGGEGEGVSGGSEEVVAGEAVSLCESFVE